MLSLVIGIYDVQSNVERTSFFVDFDSLIRIIKEEDSGFIEIEKGHPKYLDSDYQALKKNFLLAHEMTLVVKRVKNLLKDYRLIFEPITSLMVTITFLAWILVLLKIF
jgi:hypothetical protein